MANPPKLMVIDCNTGTAKLTRRKTLLSNVKRIGFESVLLEKQKRIGIYRASLNIPSSYSCLCSSPNGKDEVRLKLVAWDIWKSDRRSGDDEKDSRLVVEVELGVEEGNQDNVVLTSRDESDTHFTTIEENPILQDRHNSSSPSFVLLQARLRITDPAQLDETTLELLSGKALLRIPYHNETSEFESFCDDFDERYANHQRCASGDKVSQLKCRFCGNGFLPISISSPLRVFQLPSGHFDDIVDDMICFEGPLAVPMTAREVTFTRKGRLLMGDSFCLLHPSDVNVGTIDVTVLKDDEKEEEEEEQNDEREGKEFCVGSIQQKMARCSRCKYWLGGMISPPPCQEGSKLASTEIHTEDSGGFCLLLHRILGVPWVRKSSEAIAEYSVSNNNVQDEKHMLSPPLLFENFRARHWLLHKVRKAVLVDRCFSFLVTVKNWGGQRNNKEMWQDRAIFLRVINAESLISTSEDLPPMRAVSVQFCVVNIGEMEERRPMQRVWVRLDEYDDIFDSLSEVSGFISQLDCCRLSIYPTIDRGGSCERLSFLL